jgi:hypothetical protein
LIASHEALRFNGEHVRFVTKMYEPWPGRDDFGSGFHVHFDGGELVVTHPTSGFFAVYRKSKKGTQLLLVRRADNATFLTQSFKVAVAKARELGWIV